MSTRLNFDRLKHIGTKTSMTKTRLNSESYGGVTQAS